MSNATKLPTLVELGYFQWARKGSPKPTLAAPIDEDDTTLQFSHPPLDQNNNVVTYAFEMGVRKSNGWVETCLIPAGGLSADGLTATGVIRGLRPAGIDYATGSSSFRDSHQAGEPVFCNIPAIIPALLTSVLQGAIASGGNNLIIGTDAEGTVTISRSTGTGTYVGWLRWDNSSDKGQFSNDGTTWTSFSDAVASVIFKISSADTTPGYAYDKIIAGSGITITKNNPGGNETMTISADAIPAFTAVEDITVGAPVSTTSTSNGAENLIRNVLTSPGAALAYDTGTVTYTAACRVDTGKIAVIFKESSAWYVICGTIAGAGQTIVWGTRQQINSGAGSVKPDCAQVSDGKVIFTYVDSSNNLQARVATVSGTTFTFGAEVQVKAATVTTPAVALVGTDKVMFAFNHGVGFGRVSIGTISGVTLTVDTANEQQFLASTVTHVSASKAGTDKGFIVYANSSKGTGVVVSCGSTTPAPGTPVDFDTNVSVYNRVRYVSSDKVLVVWRDTTSNVTQARIATISGTVITYPTAELAVNSVVNCTDIDAVVYPSGKIFVAWRDVTNSKGTFQEVILSGTSTLTNFLPTVDFVATAVDATAGLALASVNDNNKVCVVYTDNTTKDGTGRVYQDYSNTQLYAGIAQSTVVKGASVSVKPTGIDTNQSGLTLGQNVQSGGIVIGRAVTATSLEIITDANEPTTTPEYAIDAGSTDAYEVNPSPPWYAYTTGKRLVFKAATANTAAATLNVCGLGAKTIKKYSNTDLLTGDITAGQLVEVVYDGTNFQLISPTKTNLAFFNTGAVACSVTGSGSQNIAHGLGMTPKLTKITAVYGVRQYSFCWSMGTWDGTNKRCMYVVPNSGATGTANVNTTEVVHLQDSAGNYCLVGTIAVDDTNIALTITNGNTASQFLWEVYA